MFALIETNGATHIAIHVPHEGSDKTLPALAAMLEVNAVFLHAGYQESTAVKPKMTIVLGGSFHHNNYDVDIAIVEPGTTPPPVIGAEWVIALPEFYASNAPLRKKLADLETSSRTKVAYLEQQLRDQAAQLARLEGELADLRARDRGIGA